MPTHGYECDSCGLQLECQQVITEQSLTVCPKYGGEVRRVLSSGAGSILIGSSCGRRDQEGDAPPCAIQSKPFVDVGIAGESPP